MNNLINNTTALEAALDQAGLEAEGSRLMDCRLEGDCYRLELSTDYMRYELYVDAHSGELLGLDCSPIPYVDLTEGESCAELLSDAAAA